MKAAADFSAEEKLASLMGGRSFSGNVVPMASAAVPTLRADDVHLGDTVANIPIGIGLAALLKGRLLIQGNSGAGKSMLLRRLFEQAFGHVQQLLIDSDGEFSTLAEHFDVAVLGVADVLRVGARTFALHLREHRYSAILDFSDATGEQRFDIVAELAGGLIDAPEHHWHPLLVLVDEAQTFAPRYDTGDVEPVTRKRTITALADMMGRGRKRGIAGIIATQRLAETATPVVSKATNIIAGRTIFDRDLERTAALLGFTVGQGRPLRTLANGEFLCLGPAIAGSKRVRFRTGPVKSRHKGETPDVVAPPAISAARAGELLRTLPAASEVSPLPKPDGGHLLGSGRRGRDWRREEDEIIRTGYAVGEPIAHIGARLAAIGFSTSTIYISMRAHALGLISAKAAVAWSAREDQILRDAYIGEVRIIDIKSLLAAEGFHRGRVAIQMRAINLGITRDRVNYWTEAEKQIAIAGLTEGKPYREILQDLRDVGFHRGNTALFKFAQRHNFNRGADLWTAEEIELLRRRYGEKVNCNDIAEELGKTVSAVRGKASVLRLKQRFAWSDKECKILVDACEKGKTLVSAAQMIGRPYVNVARMAVTLKLSFKKTLHGSKPALRRRRAKKRR